MIRKEVEDFVRLGPLPDEEASEEIIFMHQHALKRIQEPVTDEEAERLAECFGPSGESCFGLDWAILSLIETTPSARDRDLQPKPPADANDWIRRLWDRARRGREWGYPQKPESKAKP